MPQRLTLGSSPFGAATSSTKLVLEEPVAEASLSGFAVAYLFGFGIRNIPSRVSSSPLPARNRVVRRTLTHRYFPLSKNPHTTRAWGRSHLSGSGGSELPPATQNRLQFW